MDCTFSVISGLMTVMKVAYGRVNTFGHCSPTYIPRRLPMARVWPPSRFGFPSYPLSQQSIDLPPQETQDRLLELYFTNIHPTFPVLHKTRFLTEYNTRFLKISAPSWLLLIIFSESFLSLERKGTTIQYSLRCLFLTYL